MRLGSLPYSTNLWPILKTDPSIDHAFEGFLSFIWEMRKQSLVRKEGGGEGPLSEGNRAGTLPYKMLYALTCN